MDELVIDEKRYISSKRAAKITGYAKDYVGQLCREGRLQARLIGRNWYVLESAIQDHRFGGMETAKKDLEQTPAPVVISEAEFPKYEAVETDGLPIMREESNGILDEETVPQTEPAVAQDLQESWREWFERLANGESAPPVEEPRKEIHNTLDIEEPSHEPATEALAENEEAANVPIRTVYAQPPKELLPKQNMLEIREISNVETTTENVPTVGRGMILLVQTIGAVVALGLAFMAVIGTGYLDTYIISDSRVSQLAGAITYTK